MKTAIMTDTNSGNRAPVHPVGETVPTPVGLATHVAHLGQRYGHDLAVTCSKPEGYTPQFPVFVREQLCQLLALIGVEVI